ncbi:MAG: hypothetical protein WED00_09380 [Aquisalimonadaceae bacterium]
MMAKTDSANRIGDDRLRSMLNICRFHRQHERFHTTESMQVAVELRRHSNALKLLADRWLATAAENEGGGKQDYADPLFQAAGCYDLNDMAGITTTGILFMEGESEPREIRMMQARFKELAEYYRGTGKWLDEKMDAGWERESVLLNVEFADISYQRHFALINTTMTGHAYNTAGRIIGAAHQNLSSVEFLPKKIRKDLRGTAQLMRTTAWLIDEAAAILAKRAAENGLVDRYWTDVIAGLEKRVGTGAAAAAPTEEEAVPNPPTARK